MFQRLEFLVRDWQEYEGLDDEDLGRSLSCSRLHRSLPLLNCTACYQHCLRSWGTGVL